MDDEKLAVQGLRGQKVYVRRHGKSACRTSLDSVRVMAPSLLK